MSQKTCKQEESEVFKILRKKATNLKFLYPVKLSLKKKVNEKYFLKQKLREFIASRPALQEMLKEVLQRKGK